MTKRYMEDEYPTEEALRRLSTIDNPKDALDDALALWNDVYGSASEELRPHEREHLGDGRFIRFATGGWSGNESIIAALQENRFAWLMTWYLSSRGGLHLFKYP